jgi:hypothetical protein
MPALLTTLTHPITLSMIGRMAHIVKSESLMGVTWQAEATMIACSLAKLDYRPRRAFSDWFQRFVSERLEELSNPELSGSLQFLSHLSEYAGTDSALVARVVAVRGDDVMT